MRSNFYTFFSRLNIIPYWTVLHQLDQKIIYPHYDFKHLTEKYFEIGMKLDDFLIQLVKYCIGGQAKIVTFILFPGVSSIFSLIRFGVYLSGKSLLSVQKGEIATVKRSSENEL